MELKGQVSSLKTPLKPLPPLLSPPPPLPPPPPTSFGLSRPQRRNDHMELRAKVLSLLRLQDGGGTTGKRTGGRGAGKGGMRSRQHGWGAGGAGVRTALLLAVHAMHRTGIAHRDLKPENILVSSGPGACRGLCTVADDALFSHRVSSSSYHHDNQPPSCPCTGMRVKIADFGLAAALARGQTTACGVVGSPFYMAPKIIRGRPYAGEVDMWSLGCILYICVSVPRKDTPRGVCFGATLGARPERRGMGGHFKGG
ncbi:unnamed protein product [Closterium sp. Yama58-4]|nr:unnamed protein product [Closterium sp. Yama58-4]